MFVIGAPISVFIVVLLVILGMRQANALKTLLMGIEVTLVGAVILIAFHLSTPFWLAPFVLIIFGLIVSFIGFYRKIKAKEEGEYEDPTLQKRTDGILS